MADLKAAIVEALRIWEQPHYGSSDTEIDHASEAFDVLREALKPDPQQDSAEAAAYRAAVPTRDGDLECDEGAIVSFGSDPGAYVQCWKWVYASDAGLDEPEEE